MTCSADYSTIVTSIIPIVSLYNLYLDIPQAIISARPEISAFVRCSARGMLFFVFRPQGIWSFFSISYVVIWYHHNMWKTLENNMVIIESDFLKSVLRGFLPQSRQFWPDIVSTQFHIRPKLSVFWNAHWIMFQAVSATNHHSFWPQIATLKYTALDRSRCLTLFNQTQLCHGANLIHPFGGGGSTQTLIWWIVFFCWIRSASGGTCLKILRMICKNIPYGK